MKKFICIVFACLSSFALLAKREFTNFERKGNKDFLAGFVKCVEIGSTEIEGLVDASKDNVLSLSLIEFSHLKRRNRMLLKKNGNNSHVVCSRDLDVVHNFISESKKTEQELYAKIGYAARSSAIVAFPINTDEDADQNVESSTKKQTLQSDDFFEIPAPSLILSVDIKNKNVSNQELGYVAYKLLQDQQNKEFDHDNYSMKITLLGKNESNEMKNLTDFLPRK